MDICYPCPLEDRIMESRQRQPPMLRCRDNRSMRVLLIEMEVGKVKTTTDKVKLGTRFSADFQIFSYKIPLQIRTKRYQDRVVEHSSLLITFSILAQQVLRSTLRESVFLPTTSKAMTLFPLIIAIIITQSHQVEESMASREAHPKMLVKTRMEVFSSKTLSHQEWK